MKVSNKIICTAFILCLGLFSGNYVNAQGKITRNEKQERTEKKSNRGQGSVHFESTASSRTQNQTDTLKTTVTNKPSIKNINITSIPNEAKIYINGSYIGLSPCKYNLEANKNYSLRIEKNGFNTFYTNITTASQNYSFTLEPSEICVIVDSSPNKGVSLMKNGKWVGYTPCEITGKKGESCILSLNSGGYGCREYNYTFSKSETKVFDVPISPIVNTSSSNNSSKEYIIIHGYNSKGKLYINGKYEGDLFPGNDGERIVWGVPGEKCKIEVQYFNEWDGKKRATRKIAVKFGDKKRVYTQDSSIRAE